MGRQMAGALFILKKRDSSHRRTGLMRKGGTCEEAAADGNVGGAAEVY